MVRDDTPSRGDDPAHLGSLYTGGGNSLAFEPVEQVRGDPLGGRDVFVGVGVFGVLDVGEEVADVTDPFAEHALGHVGSEVGRDGFGFSYPPAGTSFDREFPRGFEVRVEVGETGVVVVGHGCLLGWMEQEPCGGTV